MKILDATAGSRSIWYQKNHPFVVFMDKRIEEYQDPRKDRYFVHRVRPIMKYGALYTDSWRREIQKGSMELFRVLKPNGTFIFKWNEVNKKVDDVLKLFPYQPMFGTITGQKNNTHWILFIKYNVNKKL